MNTIFYSHLCGEEELMPKLPKGIDYHTTGIYCHGELQNLIGYDICYVPINEKSYDKLWSDYELTNDYHQSKIDRVKLFNLPLGKYECEVLANGITYNAIAFVWLTNNEVKGLVCLPNDTDSLVDAQNKFNKQASFV